MARYEFFLASSLEKVFPSRRPSGMGAEEHLSAWPGTRAAVQLVYRVTEAAPNTMSNQSFTVEVKGAPCPCRLRRVELIPSDYPCYEGMDDDYITKEPGLFPDLLAPMEQAVVTPVPRQYHSLWLSWELPADVQPGEYPITVEVHPVKQMTLPNGTKYTDPSVQKLSFELPFTLRVGRAQLPEQSLIHTEWFHADSLAQYYHVEPLSEEHWTILENFIRAAGMEHGINMLLTPVFTPPLDTAVGSERMTIQLVDVFVENGRYHFGFGKLARWAALCQKYQVQYLEIAHLFTQWGAAATPKIVACVDGKEKRIFGWDVPATHPEYRRFLEAFLPALKAELEELGYDRDHVYFHISDEPSADHVESYRAAKAQVEDLLADCHVIDALSGFEYYQQKLVRQPIPSNDHIQPFLDAKVPNLWVYYCCCQGNLVPNRFFSMESYRNRIMGVLMYLYDIKGFLQWGYNFYSSKFSLHPIDPYMVTHADYAFPSGDAYLVYPGKNGEALSSLRAEVQSEALLDMRALQCLEQLTSREFTESVIYEGAEMRPLTFSSYPRSAEYLLHLRERVAQEIEKHL